MRIRSFLTRSVVLGVMLASIGCAGRGGGNGSLTGAASARAAVDQFMTAVKAQDIQALSTIWGTPEGPARDRMPRPELERRELLMMCYLTHDSFLVQEETGGERGSRVFRLVLTRAGATRPTTFTTVRGPSDRWYVQDADLTQLQAFCAQRR